ncbi:MAG: ankyrin repeat domain-containing protein [Tatlockia sp.]|nr:ankyrin repeat domain-containing protein [Tatlockia sp.]
MLIEIDPLAEPGEDEIILSLMEDLNNLDSQGKQIVLLDKELSPRILTRVFNTAVINGLVGIVKQLSNIDEIYQILNFKEAIEAAAQKGNLEIIIYLYEIHPKATVPDGSNALCLAAQEGYLNIVKYLVEVPKVEPNALKNAAILAASEHKQQKVIEYLATQPSYDPFKKENSQNKNKLIRLLTNFGATKERNSHHVKQNLFLFFACSQMKSLDKDSQNKIVLAALELDYKCTDFKL